MHPSYCTVLYCLPMHIAVPPVRGVPLYLCTALLLIRRGLSVEEARRLARENAKDIIACGFDVARTFIFSDFE